MKLILLAGLALFSPIPLPAATDDAAEIREVVERFRIAIIAKDAAALNALPANDGITFLSSLDTATLARVRRARPNATRVTNGRYAEFVHDVTTAREAQEEVFSNIIVHADGSVATIWFDYDFRENGVVTNFGHESWGLIRSDAGWKISSIIYSISVPAAKR